MEIDLAAFRRWIQASVRDAPAGKVVTVRFDDLMVMISEIERLRGVVNDFKRAVYPQDYTDISEESVEKLYHQAEQIRRKLDKLTSTTAAEYVRLRDIIKKIKEVAELKRTKHG